MLVLTIHCSRTKNRKARKKATGSTSATRRPWRSNTATVLLLGLTAWINLYGIVWSSQNYKNRTLQNWWNIKILHKGRVQVFFWQSMIIFFSQLGDEYSEIFKNSEAPGTSFDVFQFPDAIGTKKGGFFRFTPHRPIKTENFSLVKKLYSNSPIILSKKKNTFFCEKLM